MNEGIDSSMDVKPAELSFVTSSKSLIFKEYLGMKVWELRHLQVSKLIGREKICSVMDIGCSDGKLLQRLSRSPQLHTLIGFDIDDEILRKQTICNVIPEPIQNSIQFERSQQQCIQIYKANASMKYRLFRQKECQLITLVEVIEHLSPDIIDLVVDNIFGFLSPPYVFITTPNKDFNVYFSMGQGQMRHWDHKFQWNRLQFVEFVKQTAKKYQYDYQIIGIGQHKAETNNGCCSQGAIFKSKLKFSKYQESQMEQTQSPHLMAQYLNQSWKQNIEEEITRNSFFCLNLHSEKASWGVALNYIKERQIGKALLNEEIDLTEQYIQAILSKNSKIICDQQGFYFKQLSDSQSESQFQGIHQMLLQNMQSQQQCVKIQLQEQSISYSKRIEIQKMIQIEAKTIQIEVKNYRNQQENLKVHVYRQ